MARPRAGLVVRFREVRGGITRAYVEGEESVEAVGTYPSGALYALIARYPERFGVLAMMKDFGVTGEKGGG